MSDGKECECRNWCSDGRLPRTSHHYQCKHYNLAQDSLFMVRELTEAMEKWSADCDGMPNEAWEAYKKALLFSGQWRRFHEVSHIEKGLKKEIPFAPMQRGE